LISKLGEILKKLQKGPARKMPGPFLHYIKGTKIMLKRAKGRVKRRMEIKKRRFNLELNNKEEETPVKKTKKKKPGRPKKKDVTNDTDD